MRLLPIGLPPPRTALQAPLYEPGLPTHAGASGLFANQWVQDFIVSGAGQDFIRVFADKTYCVSPEHVVGSTTATQYQVQNSSPVLLTPSVEPVEDGPGKPVAIERFIGQRPIFACGNSDGDKEMLEWTRAGGGLRFMGIVHHTDADREWAYDRDSDVGRLDKVLDEANAQGWTIVDMKRDWNVVFPIEEL